MQLQGLLIMLFILAVIPIMILSSNHEIFFILIAFILLITSIRNLHKKLIGANGDNPDTDGDPEEELEEMLDIDMQKFGAGIDIAKNLIIILFLAYCAFYLNLFLFKALAALAILLQIYFILEKVKTEDKDKISGIQSMGHILSNSLNLVILLLTVFNKLTGSRF